MGYRSVKLPATAIMTICIHNSALVEAWSMPRRLRPRAKLESRSVQNTLWLIFYHDANPIMGQAVLNHEDVAVISDNMDNSAGQINLPVVLDLSCHPVTQRRDFGNSELRSVGWRRRPEFRPALHFFAWRATWGARFVWQPLGRTDSCRWSEYIWPWQKRRN